MGAPLDFGCRSTIGLRSTLTLSPTLLSIEFMQCPQHVLSNLLGQPHTLVLAGSSTVAFSSAFSFALSLAFPSSPPFAFQSAIRCSFGFFSGWAAKYASLSASYTLH